MTAYDKFGRIRPLDAMARCQACGRWISYTQSCRALDRPGGGPVRGFEHQYCPPRLVRTKENA